MRKSFLRQEGNERRESPAKISLRIIPRFVSTAGPAALRDLDPAHDRLGQ
jgi:hypothetical protein